MKNLVFLLLMFSFPILGIAQKNQSIDIVLGGDYSYRYLNTSSNDNAIALIIDNRNESEESSYAWRAGLNYNRKLSDHFYLKSGLRFANLSYGDYFGELKYPNQHDGMGGHDPTIEVGENLGTLRTRNRYYFVEVPIMVRYEMGRKKVKPFLEAGISPHIFLFKRGASFFLFDERYEIGNSPSTGFNTINFVGQFSLGSNYSLSEKLELFGQASFRYHLTPLVDAPINEHLYTIGLEMGARKLF